MLRDRAAVLLRRWVVGVAACACLSAIAGCHRSAALPAVVRLTIRGHTLTAEVAVTEARQRRGLMGRHSLAVDEGMLFPLRSPSRVCMWMKDTPVPLAVAFVDAAGVVVNVAQMEPDTTTEHCSAAPVMYALEVGTEWAGRGMLIAGDRVAGLPLPGR